MTEAWTQPRYVGRKLELDGQTITCHGRVRATPIAGGPNILRMADGSVVIQHGYKGAFSEVAAFLRFEFDQQADQQAEWDKVDDVRALGQAVYFIPYRVETEAFIAATGDTTFSLRRVLASYAMSGFDTASYPNAATLNGVAQTIISSGTPTSGQVKLEQQTVTTPTLSASDELIVKYYPAYAVVAQPDRDELRAFNDLQRPVVLWESNLQVPS